jgi:hypothetical protein
MALQAVSRLSDAVEDVYRIHDEWLAAFRAGEWAKSQRLLCELEKANRRRRELTPPPPSPQS